MPASALPPHLKTKLHNDWIFPLCYIPRAWTAFKLGGFPILIKGYNINYWGNFEGHSFPHPIQNKLKGKWCSFQLCLPLFISITVYNGYYFYCGFRYDGVDNYFQFPAIDISKAEKFES